MVCVSGHNEYYEMGGNQQQHQSANKLQVASDDDDDDDLDTDAIYVNGPEPAATVNGSEETAHISVRTVCIAIFFYLRLFWRALLGMHTARHRQQSLKCTF